jgi:stage III sporulation protein AD
MDSFWQWVAGAMLTVVLGIALGKQSKDISLVLTMVVCCMVLMGAAAYLQPVMEFVKRLQAMGQLDDGYAQILLKAVGIGLVTEFAVLICNDSGNSALGKSLQIAATVVVLWISLPLMESLLDLIERIMGGI